MASKITRDMAKQFARYYMDGRSATSIAEEFGLSPQTVVAHLVMNGVEIRPRGGFSAEKRKEREVLWNAVAAGYREGKSLPMLADEFAISISAARLIAQREGVDTRKRGEKSPQFLKKLADRNAAIADGYRGGKSVKSLMEEFDVSEKTVRRAMAEHGAGPRKGGGK